MGLFWGATPASVECLCRTRADGAWRQCPHLAAPPSHDVHCGSPLWLSQTPLPHTPPPDQNPGFPSQLHWTDDPGLSPLCSLWRGVGAVGGTSNEA